MSIQSAQSRCKHNHNSERETTTKGVPRLFRYVVEEGTLGVSKKFIQIQVRFVTLSTKALSATVILDGQSENGRNAGHVAQNRISNISWYVTK